jgi:hypothetical protein
MDERFRIFFCILGAAVGFGLIGAVFGAVARALFHASGKASGTAVGAAAVRGLEYLRGEDLSPWARARVSGAADGALFLGVLGGLFGAYAGYQGPEEMPLLLGALLGAAILALAAVLFGVAGYAMAGTGVRVVVLLFVGGICGALVGALAEGPDGLLVGTLAGAFLGIAVSVWTRPRSPHEEEPAPSDPAPPEKERHP